MTWLTTFLKELKRPDDQGRDWYGWVTNQLSHVCMGAMGYSVIGGFILIFALFKETADIKRGGKFKDSLQDFLFWFMGVMFLHEVQKQPYSFGDPLIPIIVIAAMLLSGMIARYRRSLNPQETV